MVVYNTWLFPTSFYKFSYLDENIQKVLMSFQTDSTRIIASKSKKENQDPKKSEKAESLICSNQDEI